MVPSLFYVPPPSYCGGCFVRRLEGVDMLDYKENQAGRCNASKMPIRPHCIRIQPRPTNGASNGVNTRLIRNLNYRLLAHNFILTTMTIQFFEFRDTRF